MVVKQCIKDAAVLSPNKKAEVENQNKDRKFL